MKKIIFFTILLFVVGCKNLIKSEFDENLIIAENIYFEPPKSNSNLVISSKEDFLGYWVGQSTIDRSKNKKIVAFKDRNFETEDFEFSKKITLSIDKINASEIKGHAIISGVITKFRGTLSQTTLGFEIYAKEVNNTKNAEEFSLNIKTNDTLLLGTSLIYDKDGTVYSNRKLKLAKKIFTYNQNNNVERKFVDFQKSIMKKMEFESEDSIGNPIKEIYDDEQFYTTTRALYKINPSAELLKKEVVENLSKGDIFILRNLIFARHGFVFKDKTLRRFFDFHSWYMPVFSDVNKDLTEIEKKNAALLLRYEQNAKEYYEHFGR